MQDNELIIHSLKMETVGRCSKWASQRGITLVMYMWRKALEPNLVPVRQQRVSLKIVLRLGRFALDLNFLKLKQRIVAYTMTTTGGDYI